MILHRDFPAEDLLNSLYHLNMEKWILQSAEALSVKKYIISCFYKIEKNLQNRNRSVGHRERNLWEQGMGEENQRRETERKQTEKQWKTGKNE